MVFIIVINKFFSRSNANVLNSGIDESSTTVHSCDNDEYEHAGNNVKIEDVSGENLTSMDNNATFERTDLKIIDTAAGGYSNDESLLTSQESDDPTINTNIVSAEDCVGGEYEVEEREDEDCEGEESEGEEIEGEESEGEESEGEESESEESESDDIDGDTTENRNDYPERRMEGRRIIDMNFLMDQLTEISEHSEECRFNDFVIEKEIRNGLQSKMIYRCRNCGEGFEVMSNTSEPMSINSATVLATNMIGIGYSQSEQFGSVIDVPVMCSDNYKKLNDTIGSYWEETAEESMRQAAEDERKAAIDRGDVDAEDGIPFITVVTDEAWSKRLFKRNFTALSGVAAIVGAHTGKILWIAVRNKYCVTCVRAENKEISPPPHNCTKNFTGPSSEMEWQSILEGFQCSVELHKLRYLKLVADGDSSTYSKLMELKPYGDRYIQKYECKNHLKRNFRTQLESTAEGCPRGLRNHMIKTFKRMRKDVNCAIEYRKRENTTEEQKVALLKSDINNITHHAFGDHSNCPSYIREYCNDDDENFIPALQQCDTYEKICQVMRRLMYCSWDLLLGYTNNSAEHYNSIVAKFVGGKRVNFSLSNSYKYKAIAAAVQYNEKSPLNALYQTKFNIQPSKLATKVQVKRLRKCERDKERRQLLKANKIYPKRFCKRKEPAATGYGVRADLPEQDFENEKEIFAAKLEKYQEIRLSIERDTHDKNKCSLWKEVSRKVLMTPYFGLVCKARAFAGHVKTISQGSFGQSKAAKHALECQHVALEQLGKELEIETLPCGLFIDKEHKCLAASPTGTVGSSDMIVHIECPVSIFNKDPNDNSVLAKLTYMELSEENKMVLKKNDSIYYDIQGQLHICEKKICLFSIWTSTQHKMYVQRINIDNAFFDTKMKPQLLIFYNDWLFPELVDSRLARGMPVREPSTTQAAQASIACED